jgi:hypothetical protein
MSPSNLRFATFATDWGIQFATAAQLRGYVCRMIPPHGIPPYVAPDPTEILFARLPQADPHDARAWALAHIRAGGKCVQSANDLRCYENRATQMALLEKWYPPGALILHGDRWDTEMQRLGLPLVSKARFGSSSTTVRALLSREDCKKEAMEVFTTGKDFRGGRKQYGELLWQQMLPGNEFALRVARITPKWGWAFKVMNRPHDWRASGSGQCVPLTMAELWEYRYAINTFLDLADFGLNSRWCAADMLYDKVLGVWKAVDVTLAWNLSRNLAGGNYDAPIIGLQTFAAHPKGYRGRDQWACLLDDIEDHGIA